MVFFPLPILYTYFFVGLFFSPSAFVGFGSFFLSHLSSDSIENDVYEWAWTVFHLVCWWMIVVSVVWRQTRAPILFVKNSGARDWYDALTCVCVHIFILTTDFLIFFAHAQIRIALHCIGRRERVRETKANEWQSAKKECILFNYFFSTFVVNCVHNAI